MIFAGRWGEAPRSPARDLFSVAAGTRCREAPVGGDAGSQRRDGGRGDAPEGEANRSDFQSECAGTELSFDQPLDSFVACASVRTGSTVNLSALESNRGSLHRHLEAGDGDKPAGRAFLGHRNRRRSRKGINRSCNSEGISSVMWIRRRRSADCSSKFLRPRASDAHVQPYRRCTHLRADAYMRQTHIRIQSDSAVIHLIPPGLRSGEVR